MPSGKKAKNTKGRFDLTRSHSREPSRGHLRGNAALFCFLPLFSVIFLPASLHPASPSLMSPPINCQILHAPDARQTQPCADRVALHGIRRISDAAQGRGHCLGLPPRRKTRSGHCSAHEPHKTSQQFCHCAPGQSIKGGRFEQDASNQTYHYLQARPTRTNELGAIVEPARLDAVMHHGTIGHLSRSILKHRPTHGCGGDCPRLEPLRRAPGHTRQCCHQARRHRRDSNPCGQSPMDF